MTWGYRTPKEAAEKRKRWINARIEKAPTGSYFRHMFREGRVIVPAGGHSYKPTDPAPCE
jgi:putative SOS response-associated peptidase YedK